MYLCKVCFGHKGERTGPDKQRDERVCVCVPCSCSPGHALRVCTGCCWWLGSEGWLVSPELSEQEPLPSPRLQNQPCSSYTHTPSLNNTHSCPNQPRIPGFPNQLIYMNFPRFLWLQFFFKLTAKIWFTLFFSNCMKKLGTDKKIYTIAKNSYNAKWQKHQIHYIHSLYE